MLQRKGLDPCHLNTEKLRLKYQELITKKKELSLQHKSAKSELNELELIAKNLQNYLEIKSPETEQSWHHSTPGDIHKFPEK